MSKFFTRCAAAAVLATTIFAGGSGPANAAPDSHLKQGGYTSYSFDTGWG